MLKWTLPIVTYTWHTYKMFSKKKTLQNLPENGYHYLPVVPSDPWETTWKTLCRIWTHHAHRIQKCFWSTEVGTSRSNATLARSPSPSAPRHDALWGHTPVLLSRSTSSPLPPQNTGLSSLVSCRNASVLSAKQHSYRTAALLCLMHSELNTAEVRYLIKLEDIHCRVHLMGNHKWRHWEFWRIYWDRNQIPPVFRHLLHYSKDENNFFFT